MASSGQNSAMSRGEGRGIVLAEANFGKPSRGELEAMARRRFQDPVPKREGNWWYLLYWVTRFRMERARGNVSFTNEASGGTFQSVKPKKWPHSFCEQ